MARCRRISTEISKDRLVNRLAQEYGDFAALLYSWMLPHAEDDCSLPDDPEEIAYLVMPGRRDKPIEAFAEAIQGMLQLRLIFRIIENNHSLLIFPPDAFYHYQNYIPAAKRRTSPKNTEERREIPQNASSPSPSPSPSPSENSNSLCRKSPTSDTPKKPKAEKFPPESEAFVLSGYLLKKIRENKADFKQPNIQVWAAEMDRLLRLDKREPKRVVALINWCQADNFWWKNVLSVGKLREKFDELEAKSQERTQTPGNGQRDLSKGYAPPSPIEAFVGGERIGV